MECGVQSHSTATAMLGVPTTPPGVGVGVGEPVTGAGPGGPGAGPNSVQTPHAATAYSPSDSEQAQFEADKRAVYKHPLFPLLALLFERCELATQSPDPQSSEAFNLDIQAFVQHQERDRKPFLANEPEIDGLMIKAIQVLRIHLLELEKVQELCKDFCNRYITCLKGKMQSENLLRSDYPQDVLGTGVMNSMENNNNMMSHGNSESGSASNSPVQYNISPPQQPVIPNQGAMIERSLDNSVGYPVSHYGGPTPPLPTVPPPAENLVIHGSTPLSQIGANLCPVTVAQPPGTPPAGTVGVIPHSADSGGGSIGGGPPLSPAPTTPGGSTEDCGDCDSDFGSGRSGRKQKRGVLPKHATSVMRSWLFQHLVHPYPTEDEKRHIAAQTNLTLLQVNNWFINARRRILQPMLDGAGGGTPQEGGPVSGVGGASPPHKKRKNGGGGGANNRRYWTHEFAAGAGAAAVAAAAAAGVQHHLDPSGILSSSDDEGDSYSSDGEDGGGLVIDAQAGTGHADIQHPEINQNGHVDSGHLAASGPVYNGSPETSSASDRQ
nr:unnamed protein product [Callosobruchus analis]